MLGVGGGRGVSQPYYEVQRQLRNGRWVALGLWPVTERGKREAIAYRDRCVTIGLDVRFVRPPEDAEILAAAERGGAA